MVPRNERRQRMASTFPKELIKKAHISLLLRRIQIDADVSPLINRGLRYSQLIQLIKEAVESGLLERIEDGYAVTEAGQKFIQSDKITGKIRKDAGWINPLYDQKCEQAGLYDIYLPAKKNSKFK